jgi:hypothetical protein
VRIAKYRTGTIGLIEVLNLGRISARLFDIKLLIEHGADIATVLTANRLAGFHHDCQRRSAYIFDGVCSGRVDF